MDDEGGQYIYYGQPLEREEDLSRKKAKLAVDQGQARRLPPWKQEVTDAEGRRRFHGAFTGGFSAGYYNTVGSKEGWAPKAFSSSRTQRAQTAQQSVDDFLDEDELEEARLKSVGTSSDYDTFGFTAAEIARRNAAKEAEKRPSAIPGPVPDEIVVPATQSIGVKLLMKMGWRRGRVVGPRLLTAVAAARREGRKAAMALASSSQVEEQEKKVYGAQLPPSFATSTLPSAEEEAEEEIDVTENIPEFVLHPKNDVYGLGFDPLKNAPEFKDLKNARKTKDTKIWMPGRMKDSRDASGKARNIGSQFGVGDMDYFHDDDEEIYDTVAGDIEERDEDAMKVERPKPRLLNTEDCIPGFIPATSSLTQLKPNRIPHPKVPPDFDTRVTFATALDVERRFSISEPPEAEPPSDPEMTKLIDGFATFVARIGPRFEELSKEKHAGNPQFSFLVDGPGHEYYRRKLWEEQRNIAEKGNEPIEPKRKGQNEKLDAGQRAVILGEAPLPRQEKARLHEKTTVIDTSKAKLFFKDNPQKQERFEVYIKEKLVGGIKRRPEGISISRAQYELEMREFEDAFRSLETAGPKTVLPEQPKEVSELTAMMTSRFTSGTVETISLAPFSESGSSSKELTLTGEYPRREENPWRPSAMLCKRFNLIDPFAGKPVTVTKPKTQTDSFILGIISAEEGAKKETPQATVSASLSLPGTSSTIKDTLQAVEEELKPVKTITEKPVDLYKAIFSDEEDEDEDIEGGKETSVELHEHGGKEVTAKQSEAAQAALNRLAAGDFLESLGKELGLTVPVEKPRVELNLYKGPSRPANSGVVEKSVASKVSSEPDQEKSNVESKKTGLDPPARADGQEKVSRWAPMDNDLVQNRSTESAHLGGGPANSDVGEALGKNLEGEPGSQKKVFGPSKDHRSSSSSDEDSESEPEERRRRHSKKSREDSDSESHKRRSRRHSKRSGHASDNSGDYDHSKSRRRSKSSRRGKDDKESRRHHKRRHEKHKRKEDDGDGRKKSRLQ
ncbi:hypothetical protein R1sor_019961 [Riccia sorocarpa]|uniref:G patch domain-containing protein 1 n=1 Tax=Riccia sorocarpa TaxID=122646 RepID=A0ABD3IHB1_9MARC